MIVHELIRIAEENKYEEKLAGITEYLDRYAVSYVGENGEVPDISTIYVMKDTGKTGLFFPPNFSDEYLNSGTNVLIPEEYYDTGIAIHISDDE